MGNKFELRNDHDGLKHLFEQPTLNARQRRWMELLCEYDFDIKHIQGKENKVADALSRKMHVMHVAAISTGKSDLRDKILEAVTTDEHYQQVKDGLQQQKVPQKFYKYRLVEDGILMHRDRIYVPNSESLKKFIYKNMHNVLYAGHSGYQKTVAAVRKQYWPGIKNDVAEYIARCMECQKVKVEHRHPAGLLQPLPIPDWKWDAVMIN